VQEKKKKWSCFYHQATDIMALAIQARVKALRTSGSNPELMLSRPPSRLSLKVLTKEKKMKRKKNRCVKF
jgi:hypothetical protein